MTPRSRTSSDLLSHLVCSFGDDDGGAEDARSFRDHFCCQPADINHHQAVKRFFPGEGKASRQDNDRISNEIRQGNGNAKAVVENAPEDIRPAAGSLPAVHQPKPDPEQYPAEKRVEHIVLRQPLRRDKEDQQIRQD